ncbi:MAG: PAS domain-containing protein, partial [Anaerolineae bacterium]
MPGARRHAKSNWCSAILRKLRSYSLLTLPIALLLVLALGWYLVMLQNQLLTGAAVVAYQQTELEMARVLARSVERFVAEQAESEAAAPAAVERVAVARYVDPVRLLTSGGAWLYAPGRGLLDSGSGLPDTHAARSVAGALATGEAEGTPGVSGLARALGAGGEGTYLSGGSAATAREVVAWAPVRTGDETLLVGIAVPLDEILDSTGVSRQMWAFSGAMGVASIASVALLIAWLRSETRRMESEAALRRAHQNLEERVLERTAALREVNEALSDSERRYREFADSLPQVVFETDARGVFTFVNRTAWEILAVSPEEFASGVNAMTLMAPGSREHIVQDMMHVLAGEELVGAEYDVRMSDGTLVPALMHANVVRRDGVPVGIRGVVIDIRERKAAEEALRQSERRFRDMLEKVQLFTAILDADGRIIFCNPCLLQATGWKWTELAGRDWFDTFVPPENRQHLRTRFSEYRRVEIEPMRHRVQQLVTRSGERRTVFWNIIALYDGEGRLTGSASLGEDITDRLRAERALQESEERYRALFDSTNDALFVHPASSLDGSGRYIEVNETACRMLGYTREELLQLSPVQIATP